MRLLKPQDMVEGKISKKEEVIVNRGRKYFKRRDLMERDDCAEKDGQHEAKTPHEGLEPSCRISVTSVKVSALSGERAVL